MNIFYLSSETKHVSIEKYHKVVYNCLLFLILRTRQPNVVVIAIPPLTMYVTDRCYVLLYQLRSIKYKRVLPPGPRVHAGAGLSCGRKGHSRGAESPRSSEGRGA